MRRPLALLPLILLAACGEEPTGEPVAIGPGSVSAEVIGPADASAPATAAGPVSTEVVAPGAGVSPPSTSVSSPPPDPSPPPDTRPAPPPPRAPIFELPMQMVGTEPFWGGMITANTITFEGVDRPKLTMPAGERKVTGAGVSWRTRAVKGSPTEVSVVLVRETCSDGMSDKRYPFAATVTLGAETLKGCAIRRADFGGER